MAIKKPGRAKPAGRGTAPYFGLTPGESDYKSSRVVVLPVPFGGTVTFGRGTEKGPEAIRVASQQVELFDEEPLRQPYLAGIHSAPPVPCPERLAPEEMVRRVEARVGKYLEDGKFVVTLGGEHSIVAITEKMTTHDGHFIELGHNIPAPLSEDIKRRVEAFVLSFLDEIGQECGPCHTEIRIAKSGPRIIESQTRVGGDRIWEMVELALGVDLITATLEYLAFGRIPAPGIAGKKAASIRFFMNEGNSISRVGGLEKAREMLGVVRVTYDAGKKDSTGGRSNDSRQGYVLAMGGDVSESASRAALAYQTVSSS